MPDLRQTRRKIQIALLVMAGIDLLALIVYMSPLVGSPERRQQEIRELQSELNAKTREVLPLEDLPKKIQVANREIADFYRDRIPEQQSQIAAELGNQPSTFVELFRQTLGMTPRAWIAGLEAKDKQTRPK